MTARRRQYKRFGGKKAGTNYGERAGKRAAANTLRGAQPPRLPFAPIRSRAAAVAPRPSDQERRTIPRPGPDGGCSHLNRRKQAAHWAASQRRRTPDEAERAEPHRGEAAERPTVHPGSRHTLVTSAALVAMLVATITTMATPIGVGCRLLKVKYTLVCYKAVSIR